MTVAKTLGAMFLGALITMLLIFVWKKVLVGRNVPLLSNVAEQV